MKQPLPIPKFCPAAAVLLALAFLGTPAGAASPKAPDRLDLMVARKANSLLDKLKEKKYQNVGVLKFRVKQGDQPETFDAGVLPSVLANAVENALILQNDETEPLGIIRNARCAIAAHEPRFSYLKADHLDKLFELKYPLAWGKEKVTADAFITGLAAINPGKGTLTVSFEVLDRKTKKREVVDSFEARTDRAVLTDLCRGFVLASDNIRKAKYDPDKGADDDANQRNTRPQPISRDDKLVDLDIVYDGEKQVVAEHKDRGGEFQVSQPKENQEVTFLLTNLTDQRLGVVLAINGENTLNQEYVHERRPEDCSRWILEPKGRYRIRGFYQGMEVVPIKVLSDADSDRLDQSPTPRLGAIEMYVLVEQGEKGQEPTADLLKAPVPPTTTPKTAKEAKEAAQKANPSRVKAAGYISKSDRPEPTDLTEGVLKNPQMWRNVVIWYREPKGSEK